MILVAGGTGTLGTRLVRALTGSGMPVRVLTRDAGRASHLTGDCLEVHVGDIRDPNALAEAMHDVSAVVSAVQGFAGPDAVGAQAVDIDGNANLTRAALAEGTRRFVLLSVAGAAPNSSFELRRDKYRSEEALMRSGLEWTVVRPTAYLETWLGLLADMIASRGSATIFGRGNNPINFVSASDVAALVENVLLSNEMVGATLEIGGPEDLTLNGLAERLIANHGTKVPIRHVPLPLLRLMSTLLRPIKPTIATLASFGVAMDTNEMTLAHDTARAMVPELPATRLADLLAAEPTRPRTH
jgi:uncharacterized protein YbjT (DUF2867 family)